MSSSLAAPNTAPNPARPRVAILATGGTIAGQASNRELTTQYTSATVHVEQLLQSMPGLADLAQVSAEQIASIDSKDATPDFWVQLRAAVIAALQTHDAVIITHGTDTLEESAYFLDRTLPQSVRQKTVVMTAAMRPSTALSADGPLNLLNAMRVAVASSSAARGVLIAINNQIHGAQDFAKVNTSRVDAFASPNFGPVGAVIDAQVQYFAAPHNPSEHAVILFDEAVFKSAKVHIVYCAAGTDTGMIRYLCGQGAQGIVLAGTGNGSLAADMIIALQAAAQQGVKIVRASRVGSGYVNRNGACNDDLYGFAAAGWLNPQKARIELMLEISMC